MAKAENLEDILERAYWHFDALHNAHYKNANPSLPGPMSERDAFKSTVRHVVLEALGVNYARTAGQVSGGRDG